MADTKTQPGGKTHIDLYAHITDKFIEQLTKGIVPWRKSWKDAGMPVNIISKLPYQGINALVLGVEQYETNLFVTFKQLGSIGGRVKQGEKGHMVVFAKKTGQENGKDTFTTIHYYVFNVAQCKDIPDEYLSREPIAGLVRTPESIIEQMPACPSISNKGKNALYDPAEDRITLPKKGGSKNEEGYYAGLFHQLVHSTGHPNRLNRDGIAAMPEHGGEQYGLEELTAEIGACFLQTISGTASDQTPNPAHTKGWQDKLAADKFFIFKAAKAAQKAVNYILNTQSAEASQEEE